MNDQGRILIGPHNLASIVDAKSISCHRAWHINRCECVQVSSCLSCQHCECCCEDENLRSSFHALLSFRVCARLRVTGPLRARSQSSFGLILLCSSALVFAEFP